MFPFCGLSLDLHQEILSELQGCSLLRCRFGSSPMLSVCFQRKKLFGIAKKMPEFSSTADQAAVTD
jgi:hypothetical protein